MAELSTAGRRFHDRPHGTLFALAVPTVISLAAEPIAGIADTAFIARLGAPQLAALGVATTLLSGVIWVFNFLGIGTQTEVAQAHGRGDDTSAREAAVTALATAGGLALVLGLVAWPLLEPAAAWMGARTPVAEGAVTYLQIRLFGVPAVLVTFVCFGAQRGLLDMQTPLWISLAISAINIVLDPLLIFGGGPIPAYGIAGAAWATVASQWVGAVWALTAVGFRLGWTATIRPHNVLGLFVVGRDLVLRTSALLLFLVLMTRAATQAGAEAGAAHQAVRQIWTLTAMLLDAWAFAAQSLIGFFLGASAVATARRVAALSCGWGLATGAALCVAMLAGERAVALVLVPASALAAFGPAWLVASLCQPLNALSFATDGIHFGTADYRYLRNGMIVATALAALAISRIDRGSATALTEIWLAGALWSLIRSGVGLARIWPGIGSAPLGRRASLPGLG